MGGWEDPGDALDQLFGIGGIGEHLGFVTGYHIEHVIYYVGHHTHRRLGQPWLVLWTRLVRTLACIHTMRLNFG